MLRWITAGESHGPELIGVIEGLPAGVEILEADLQSALARRRLGYGRGARMKFEQDLINISDTLKTIVKANIKLKRGFPIFEYIDLGLLVGAPELKK